MNIIEALFLLQRIDNLIRTRATGTPRSLASRLDISECSVYRLIDRLKDQGFPIAYDKGAQTYYYQSSVDWHFEFLIDKRTVMSVAGGDRKQ